MTGKGGFKVGDLVTYGCRDYVEPHAKVIKVYSATKKRQGILFVKDLKTKEKFEEVFPFFCLWKK